MAFDKNFEEQWLDKFQIGLKKIGKADLFIKLTENKDEQKDYLENIRNEYAKTKDLKKAHTMLQEAFEKFIREYKNLNDEQMELLRKKGWGSAGKLEGNTILSTKIPKEFHKYFQTKDAQKKKYYYCHCPRIRDLFLNNEKLIDVNYCYCSAGFTKDIWEYILQKKVRVEIIESLMKGDEVCKIAIYI
jgi:predicted hydrocarbon binding protein